MIGRVAEAVSRTCYTPAQSGCSILHDAQSIERHDHHSSFNAANVGLTALQHISNDYLLATQNVAVTNPDSQWLCSTSRQGDKDGSSVFSAG